MNLNHILERRIEMNEKTINVVAPALGTVAGLGTAYLLNQRLEKTYNLPPTIVTKVKIEKEGEQPQEVEDPKVQLKRAVKVIGTGLAILWVAGFIGEAVEAKVRSEWGPNDDQSTVIEAEFIE